MSSVEAWWAGLCTRVFDKLRLTGLFIDFILALVCNERLTWVCV